MTAMARLTLSIPNLASLENGSPATIVLDGSNAVIGRSQTADWTLPDPKSYISSRHCEIIYTGGVYRLSDTSTNGTFLNGSTSRLDAPHTLADGDVFRVGPYDIRATLEKAEQQPAPRKKKARGEAPVLAAAAPAADLETAFLGLLAGAGIPRKSLEGEAADVMARAGSLLMDLLAGLMTLMRARTRSKQQIGAKNTAFGDGENNPIKFVQSPGDALVRLLNPTMQGFMPADRAIEDGFQDLQAHEAATLKAMQGALRMTLQRFSPSAVRNRAERQGLMARLLPGVQEAALWQAYEQEFNGLSLESSDTFIDVFATEFRKAYDEESRSS